jgi:hypothetical protein
MKSQVVLPPPGEFQREDLYLKRRWRRVQHLLNEFWKRWQAEFLQTLQPRQKWQQETPNLSPGDIVIVKDENSPRCKWPLARVEEAIESSDHKVRKLLLRIASNDLDKDGKRTRESTLLERPVHKVILLCKNEGPSPDEEP